MMPTPCGLKLWYIRRRDNSSMYTYCCNSEALRPPNSGGLPGNNHPLSNSSRCQRRAHSGMSELEPRSVEDIGRAEEFGQMTVQERYELGAECLDVGIKGQLHGTPRDSPAISGSGFPQTDAVLLLQLHFHTHA